MMHDAMKRYMTKFENGNVIPGSQTNGMNGNDMTNEYAMAIRIIRCNFAFAIFTEKYLYDTP